MKIEKVFLVPHFHFDFEWWKEEPHHEEDALIIIEKGLEFLANFPQFTFVIDTALPLKRFLEQTPGRLNEIRRYVAEGRLELVGGGLVSPDEGLPTGEGLIRQFFEGKRWYYETFGLDIRVGWEIDEFSHPAQIPQIMERLGFDYFVFSRGVHPYDAMHPTLFRWASPHAARALTAYWWPAHYICAEPGKGSREKNIKRFFKEMRARIPYEGARSPVPYLMIPLGGDFSIPTQDWIEFVDRWNRTDAPELTFSTPTEFFRLTAGAKLPVVTGEFAPIYSGYFSSRHLLKQRGRELENRLCTAEKTLSLCRVLGADYPHEELRRAWWEVLKSDFHDTICGTGTDRVFRKSLERYERAERIVDECLEAGDRFLSTKLSPGGQYVVNPCNWQRSETVTVDGAELVVTAPPLSVTSVGRAPATMGLTTGPDWMENGRIRVSVDEATGAVHVYDNDHGRQVLGPAGSRIAIEDDIGNLWASMPTGRAHPLKVTGITAAAASAYSAEITIRQENRVAKITRRVILPHDRKEVRFVTEVEFFGKDKRIVDTFPISDTGRWLGEEAFYTAAKADGTWPLQNGAMFDNPNYRVAVINRGIPGHEVTGTTLGLVLMRSVSMMSLLWVWWLVRNFSRARPLLLEALRLYRSGFNTYEFPLYPIHHVALRDFASEGSIGAFGALDGASHLKAKLRFARQSQAWERGAHRFEYALIADVADVGQMTRRGYEFNNPLAVRSFSGTGLLSGAALLTEGNDRAIVTAIHPYRDGFLLRCYEPAGAGGNVRFCLNMPVREAHLMETAGGKLKRLGVSNGAFTYDIAPHEIATFYLVC